MKTKKLSFKIILGFALVFLVFSNYSFVEGRLPEEPETLPALSSQGLPTTGEEAASTPSPDNLMPLPDVSSFDPFDILWKALNWFFNIVIILGVIFVIYAGFTYITSGGDPTKTKKALQILMYALIGIAIAILAKALIRLVAEFISPGIGTQLKFPGL